MNEHCSGTCGVLLVSCGGTASHGRSCCTHVVHSGRTFMTYNHGKPPSPPVQVPWDWLLSNPYFDVRPIQGRFKKSLTNKKRPQMRRRKSGPVNLRRHSEMPRHPFTIWNAPTHLFQERRQRCGNLRARSSLAKESGQKYMRS